LLREEEPKERRGEEAQLSGGWSVTGIGSEKIYRPNL